MVKWFLGLLIAFLLIDHLWIHLGGPMIEKMRGEYREGVEKMVKEGEKIEIQQTHRKSIIDGLIEKAKEFLKKEEKKDG